MSGNKRKPRKKGRTAKRRKKNESFLKRINWFFLSGVTLLIIFTAGTFLFLRHFFTESAFFEIRRIDLRTDELPERQEKLERLYFGENIFSLDLLAVKRLLEKDCARIKDAEVMRVLPDKIAVEVTLREPFAAVTYGRGFVVDSSGVVIELGKVPENMVRIEGLSFFLNMPNVGENADSQDLERVLDLLLLLESSLPEEIGLDYARLERGDNIELGVEGVPVKMGDSQYQDKVSRLKDIVSDPRIDLSRIRYIDLRFEDSVIAPK